MLEEIFSVGMAGSSAGVAAALDAPMAGPVYIIESLLKFNNYRMSICSLLSGMIAGIMAKSVLVYNPYSQLKITHAGDLNPQLILILVIMGVVMAIIGLIFTLIVRWWRLKINLPIKRVYIQLIIMALIMGFISTKFPGLLGSGQPFMIAETISDNFALSHTLILFFIRQPIKKYNWCFILYSNSM